MPTSSRSTGAHPSDASNAWFVAKVAADGRIDSLVERSADGTCRSLSPLSPGGLAVLIRGRNIEYHFDDERCLRDLPYHEVLECMRHEILLTAHKVRHGELLDEPEVLPVLKGLLARIEDAAKAFRRACDSLSRDD